MSNSPASAPGSQPESTSAASSSKEKDLATRFVDFWWIDNSAGRDYLILPLPSFLMKARNQSSDVSAKGGISETL
jgi:hypothetical protein